MATRRLVLGFLLSSSVALGGGGVTFKVDVEGGIPGISEDFEGAVSNVYGRTNAVNGWLFVLLKDFDAGWIPMRTTHLREHMKADVWPKIEVEWTNWVPTLSWAKVPIQVTMWGKKQVVNADLRKVDKVVEAKFTVKLSDHGIPLPQKYGATVQDKIPIVAWMEMEE